MPRGGCHDSKTAMNSREMGSHFKRRKIYKTDIDIICMYKNTFFFHISHAFFKTKIVCWSLHLRRRKKEKVKKGSNHLSLSTF